MKLLIDIPKEIYDVLYAEYVFDPAMRNEKTLFSILQKSIANGTPEPESKWIPVSERLPKDGTWNIWQNKIGQISIERYKEDMYDHFYPSGRFFELEDAIAWQPLPKRYIVIEGGKNE